MATTVLDAGVITSFPAFGCAASASVFVKSSPGITSVLPSFVETVVLPLSSTVTTASGFTSFTFAAIAAFSSGVSEAGFFTNVLSAGLTTLFPAFGTVIKSSFFTTWSGVIITSSPFGVVTVTLPSASWVTDVAFGFTFLTASNTFAFSSAVNALGSFTATLLAGILASPIPLIAFLATSLMSLTSWFAVTFSSSIAFLASVAISSTSSLRASLALSDRSVRASIACFLAVAASSIAFLASGLTFASGFTALTSATPVVLAVSTAVCAAVALSEVSAIAGWALIASVAFLARACASFLAASFSSVVKSLRPSSSFSFSANSSATAFFACSLAIGYTDVTSATPLSSVSLTSFCAVAAASAVSALSGWALTFVSSASANFLASALAASFSACVKSLRSSISLFLAVNAFAIASLAFSFATGLTLPISAIPVPFAVSTAASVVAASIAFVASSAALLTLARAASFSACVRFLSALIASAFALRAASTSALAAAFFATTGLSPAIAVVPAFWALSIASFVVTLASLIATNALSLSAFTLAIAAAFSSSVAFGVLLISAILSSAALLTALIAGCLSKLTNSDKALLSVEPSLYVTTRFPWSSFVTDLILESLSSTFLPFLSAKFASSLLLEYSSFSFSLIFSKSASVTLLGSTTATFSVGVAISYLDVWFLTINWIYPGLDFASGSISKALKLRSAGIELKLSLSLAATKLVQRFGAVSVVTPVILIVASCLLSEIVPPPVTTPLFTTPIENPKSVVLFQLTSPGPRKYISLTVVSSVALNVKSVFSPV